jgi:hypothetical protein
MTVVVGLYHVRMALRFLERELRRLLDENGRADLVEAGRVQLTDDGGTIYVHLMPSPRAWVLAWEDYAPKGSDAMYCYRWLIGEARTSLRENIGEVIRWLDGK